MEESVSFTLRFPLGVVVNCLTSYGLYKSKTMRLHFERGTVELPDIFSYRGQRMLLSCEQGERAAETERNIPHKNQFTLEIDHFSQCIRENRQPHTPSEEGLQDQAPMQAIYDAAANGRTVEAPQSAGPTRGPAPAG